LGVLQKTTHPSPTSKFVVAFYISGTWSWRWTLPALQGLCIFYSVISIAEQTFWNPYRYGVIWSHCCYYTTRRSGYRGRDRMVVSSVLLVEVTGENHWPIASHWQTLSHNVVHLALIGLYGILNIMIMVLLLLSNMYLIILYRVWNLEDFEKAEKILPHPAYELYHIMWYTLPWSRFELTTSVVVGTDCIGSCKSNYHTITATTAELCPLLKTLLW
jgi:hypothetical protein